MIKKEQKLSIYGHRFITALLFMEKTRKEKITGLRAIYIISETLIEQIPFILALI